MLETQLNSDHSCQFDSHEHASLQANIGHSVEAAGILGLIVTTLVLSHRIIPPIINVSELSRKVSRTKNIMVPLHSLVDLPRSGGSQIATISGTSISGHNVHIVIESSNRNSRSVAYLASRISQSDSATGSDRAAGTDASSSSFVSGIRYNKDSDGIVTLLMDLPGYLANVWNEHFDASLRKMLDLLEKDVSLRGVILTSAKKTFHAGADLEMLYTSLGSIAMCVPTMLRLIRLPCPLVAAINGSAVAGGMELALCCDYRICINAPGTTLGFPEVERGLIPAFATVLLPRLIGIEASVPFILGTRHVGPVDALKACLIDGIAGSPMQLIAQARERIVQTSRDAQPECRMMPLDANDSHYAREVVAAVLETLQHRGGVNLIAETAALNAAVDSSLLEIEPALYCAVGKFTQLEDPSVKGKLLDVIMRLSKIQQQEPRTQLTVSGGVYAGDVDAINSLVVYKVQQASSAATIGADFPLMDSGVDSLAAVEVQKSLQQELGNSVRIPTTLVFDYPTIAAISHFIEGALTTVESAHGCVKVQNRRCETTPDSVSCGVQTFACYTSGSCTSLMKLWVLLAGGCESLERINSIPQARFDVDALNNTALRGNHGHFIEHAEHFDHAHFHISTAEAAAMDPHQRLLLETGYSALFAFGESRESLMGSSVGVFAGVMTDSEWSACQLKLTAKTNRSVSAFVSNASGPAAVCGRVSFVLGLKGPCLSVNTACSSSLVVMNAAAHNLQVGRCFKALVAGVNIICDPVGFLVYGAALAPDGMCKTFDAAANGVGRGDACGALVLAASVDISQGVHIAGSAVNQDGRSASMSAPNGPSQVEVLQAVLSQSAQTAPREYSETHGTGTSLGDPIELGALATVWRGNGLLVLGAAKTQLGHTEGAAGLMGTIKAVLCVSCHCVTPNLHLQESNPKVDFEHFAVVMPSGIVPLRSYSSIGTEAQIGSQAGISSFGMAGTNAHVALAYRATKLDLEHSSWQQQAVYYTHVSFSWLSTVGTATAVEEVGGRASVESSTAGVVAMEYYAPNLCCSVADIEQLHSCPGRYTVGRGQEYVGFCTADEDTVSMAMSVFDQLIQSNALPLSAIGRLEVGTESQVDRAKSIKSFLMAFFQVDDLHNVEGVDTYNACYGGTNALFSTLGWIQSDASSGQYGVVVCSDPAVHPQPETISGIGASSIAILVGLEEAMPLEPVRVSFVKHAW